MKTLTEITNIISKQMGEVAKDAATDYDVIVCPERIFMDDYLPRAEAYLQSMDEMPSMEAASPQDQPYQNTIFVVIKVGSGQANMGVANYSCTLQVLSEADDFVVARQLLDSYIAKYNFEYIDGIVQSYFTPDMGGSQESVYTGFRALLSCRGNIRVPESGAAFITDVLVSVDGNIFFELPYISAMYNHSCQPDPQAFAGTRGRTMALNRQSTQTITLDVYLWNKGAYSENPKDSGTADLGLDWWLDLFSMAVFDAHSNMNRKFYLSVRTPIAAVGNNVSKVQEYIKKELDEKGWLLVQSFSSSQAANSGSGKMYTRVTSFKKVTNLTEVTDKNTLYYVSQRSTYYILDKYIKASTGEEVEAAQGCSLDKSMNVFKGCFVLTNAAYNQAWGDISSWSLTFTSALEEEK